jgi:hypothetical protein
LGIAIDDAQNRTRQTAISQTQSHIAVRVTPTNKQAVIARHMHAQPALPQKLTIKNKHLSITPCPLFGTLRLDAY